MQPLLDAAFADLYVPEPSARQCKDFRLITLCVPLMKNPSGRVTSYPHLDARCAPLRVHRSLLAAMSKLRMAPPTHRCLTRTRILDRSEVFASVLNQLLDLQDGVLNIYAIFWLARAKG